MQNFLHRSLSQTTALRTLLMKCRQINIIIIYIYIIFKVWKVQKFVMFHYVPLTSSCFMTIPLRVARFFDTRRNTITGPAKTTMESVDHIRPITLDLNMYKIARIPATAYVANLFSNPSTRELRTVSLSVPKSLRLVRGKP